MTAGTWILAFILQEPLLAFTGTTPEKDNPLLDIQEVTQNCKSLHQHNRIPREELQALALHAPGCADVLAISGGYSGGSRSPLETSHTFIFRGNSSWEPDILP